MRWWFPALALLATALAPAGTLAQHDDVTPPIGDAPIISSSVPKSTPRTDARITFDWNQVSDAESAVVYRYVLDAQAETTVGPGDGSATSALTVEVERGGYGVYYFHLRACSDGGCQPQTVHHGPMHVQPPTIREAELELLNLEFQTQTNVLCPGQGAMLVWSHPSDLPTGVDFLGYKVWRLEDGLYTKLAVLPADATGHEEPAGRLGSRYLVTLRFDGHPDEQEITTPLADDYEGVACRSEGTFVESNGDADGEDVEGTASVGEPLETTVDNGGAAVEVSWQASAADVRAYDEVAIFGRVDGRWVELARLDLRASGRYLDRAAEADAYLALPVAEDAEVPRATVRAYAAEAVDTQPPAKDAPAAAWFGVAGLALAAVARRRRLA